MNESHCSISHRDIVDQTTSAQTKSNRRSKSQQAITTGAIIQREFESIRHKLAVLPETSLLACEVMLSVVMKGAFDCAELDLRARQNE